MANDINIHPDIIASRNNDGSIVAMKADDSDLFYKITGVATLVWQGIENGDSETIIIESILSEYDITVDKVKEDITTFLTDLRKYGIIQD
jgi:hypothetical protein